jgi:hypothetical protein
VVRPAHRRHASFALFADAAMQMRMSSCSTSVSA